MTYNTRYKLKQDLPGYKKGRELGVQVNKGKLIWKFFKWDDLLIKWSGLNFDKGNIYFTLEEIQDTRFFEPIGEVRDVIPPFPSKEEIKEYYYLIGEPRLVDSVDFIRASSDIFYSDEFEEGVYKLFKKLYNKRYKL